MVLLFDGASFASPGESSLESVGWPQLFLTPYVGGLDQPVHITHAGDGSSRLFVVERAGRIHLVKGGVISDTAFLDISDRVESGGNEQGLLSVAFPPDYASEGRFYVYYTDLDGDTVVARYFLSADPDIADPASEEIVLTLEQPFTNHNGGQLAFGPLDGYLYIGLGDGGSADDPLGNGQSPTTMLGKMLRIDVETGDPITYTIPASNPFTQTVGYLPEIWALGLRNPWRFAFDRQTGDLYIGDVGQNTYEEIDVQLAASPGGENYGWNVMEGEHCFSDPNCDTTGLTLPVVEYDHTLGCSVTGGTVYRGAAYPQMEGIYLYADFCSGRIWGMQYDGGNWQGTLLLDTDYLVTTFGEDEAGELYLVDYSSGNVYRFGAYFFTYLPVVFR
jgi:glucose/arabinose dehydrogenase